MDILGISLAALKHVIDYAFNVFVLSFAGVWLAWSIRAPFVREFKILRMKKAKRKLIDQLILEIGKGDRRIEIQVPAQRGDR